VLIFTGWYIEVGSVGSVEFQVQTFPVRLTTNQELVRTSAVIPALRVYLKVVAVKKPIADFIEIETNN